MLRNQTHPLSYVQFCFFLPWADARYHIAIKNFKVMFLVTSYTHKLSQSGEMVRSLETIGVVVAIVPIEQQLEHVLSA